jgi:(1->4)-alpha-D-glucan 1-alpha-D-glucosylmutase
MSLLLIGSSHAPLDVLCAASLQTFGVFQQPAKEMNFADVMYEKKKLVMNTLLRVEMRSLGRQLAELAAQDRYARSLLRPELMDTLIEVTACFPVYRTYIRNLEVPDSAKQLIECAIEDAKTRRPHLSRACFDFLRDVLTVANPPQILSDQREDRLAFVMRWQQFTGPIVAKGLEDTALYVYYPLLSLNEVGGSPEPSKVVTWDRFVQFIHDRQQRSPDSLNASSTHDTKLSEDVHARLNALSEIPDKWATHISKWSKENEPQKRVVDGRSVPDANEEYLIYQVLIGLWPSDRSELPSISERLQGYAIKATREAMVHTRWTEPNTAHEDALCGFIQRILSTQDNSAFLCSVSRFLERVAYAGMVNSLGQTLLKITCPGVPDFYQGSELWNRRVVDLDNRQPVDFRVRTESLQHLIDGENGTNPTLVNDLLMNWPDGRIKLYVIWKALGYRRHHPALFREGEFHPLHVIGERSHHVISFLREYGKERAIVAVPRWLARISRRLEESATPTFWNGNRLQLPASFSGSWRNIFTGSVLGVDADSDNPSLQVGNIWKHFPVALLIPAE